MTSSVPTLLRATSRAVAWSPQLAGAACTVALAVAAARNAGRPAADLDAQLAVLILAAAVVTSATDRMGVSVGAVPVALWRRRAAVVAVCCAAPCLTWPLVLLAGDVGPGAAGVLSLQLVALTAAGVAAAAARPGHEAAVAGGLALGLGMARLLPADGVGQEIVAAAPTGAARLCWALLAAGGVATLLWCSRDPARPRALRRGARDARR